MLYNENLVSAYMFVPGTMALILMVITALMSSISIVREKEIGTMEILLVSPLKPIQIILGKLAPYAILSIVNAISIIIIGNFVFGVPILGSPMFGLLLPTMLLSGFIFPIENMPVALQYFSYIVPAKYFLIALKSVMLKGLGFAFIWKELLVLLGMTSLFIGISVKNFKIRLG
jgi:ABC-2 type transport system permease protein